MKRILLYLVQVVLFSCIFLKCNGSQDADIGILDNLIKQKKYRLIKNDNGREIYKKLKSYLPNTIEITLLIDDCDDLNGTYIYKEDTDKNISSMPYYEKKDDHSITIQWERQYKNYSWEFIRNKSSHKSTDITTDDFLLGNTTSWNYVYDRTKNLIANTDVSYDDNSKVKEKIAKVMNSKPNSMVSAIEDFKASSVPITKGDIFNVKHASFNESDPETSFEITCESGNEFFTINFDQLNHIEVIDKNKIAELLKKTKEAIGKHVAGEIEKKKIATEKLNAEKLNDAEKSNNKKLQLEIKTLKKKVEDTKSNIIKAKEADKAQTLESNQNVTEAIKDPEAEKNLVNSESANQKLQKSYDILKYTFLVVTIILLSALFYTVCKSDDKKTEAKDDEKESNKKANDFDQTDVPSKDLINVAPKVKKSKSKEIEEEEVQDGEEEEAVQEDEVHEEEVYDEEVHEEEVYEKEVYEEEEEKQESVENGIVYIR